MKNPITTTAIFYIPKYLIFGDDDDVDNSILFKFSDIDNYAEKPTEEEQQISAKTALVFGSQKYYDVCELLKIHPIELFPHRLNKYQRAYKSLLSNSEQEVNPPWHMIMQKEEFKTELVHFFKQVKIQYKNDILPFLSTSLNEYYENVYLRHNIIFDSLQPAKIALGPYLKALGSSENVNKAVLHGFTPDSPQNGFKKDSVAYYRNKSKTGRLIVKENSQNILTISEELRNAILSESRFGPDSSIWYLDFKSLEPRVLLYLSYIVSTKVPLTQETSLNSIDDIYKDVIDKFGKPGIINNRNTIKPIIIMTLYGASEDLILKHLTEKEGITDKRIAKELYEFVNNEYFNITNIKQYLCNVEQVNGRDFLYSYYNRPIIIDDLENDTYKFVNYVIQTTAVDVSLFGFGNIIRKLIETKTIDKIVPLYLLHDALILDVHKDYEYALPKLANYAGNIGNIPKFEQFRFPLEATRIKSDIHKV